MTATPETGKQLKSLIKKHIPEEPECACNLVSEHSPALRRRYACTGCRRMSSIVPFTEDLLEVPAMIQRGKYRGMWVLPVLYPSGVTDVRGLQARIPDINTVISANTKILGCTPAIETFKNYEYVGADPGTVDLLTRVVAMQDLPKHIVRPLAVYRCADSTKVLYKYPNLGGFESLTGMTEYSAKGSLKPEIVRSIILQLGYVCSGLNLSKICHNTANKNTLVFDSTPLTDSIDVPVSGGGTRSLVLKHPLTLLVTKFKHAAVTLPGSKLRLYRQDQTNHLTLDKVPDFKVHTCDARYSTAEGGGGEAVCSVDSDGSRTTYVVDAVYLSAARRLGVPLFYESLDFYCFVTSLMTEPAFSRTVMAEPDLREWWMKLWDYSEFLELTKRIRLISESPETASINPLVILDGLTLRCDAVGTVWSLA